MPRTYMNACDECGIATTFIEGPSGGGSTNVLCSVCKTEYVDLGPLGRDKLGKATPERLALYTAPVRQFVDEYQAKLLVAAERATQDAAQWGNEKCGCGHTHCHSYRIRLQGSVGFEKEDADYIELVNPENMQRFLKALSLL